MLAVEILILGVLLIIFIQDLRSRSVYWILFPVLGLLLLTLRLLTHQAIPDIIFSTIANLGLLSLQFLLVSLYFSLKAKTWVNITRQLLGWGDILLLASISLYLSPLNFFAFYLISLTAVLTFWLFWQLLVKTNNKTIPLAGLQAMIFAVYLAANWWLLHFNLTDDTRLLAIISGQA